MKTTQPSSRETGGSALVITLMLSAIIGITLVSYLDLTSSQTRAVQRSQQWNLIVPVMEAGVEEALTQLYYNSTNLSANDWTLGLNGFTKSRTFGSGRYVVSISNVIPPVIYATGYVPAPLGTNEISRTVRVTTQSASIFSRGLVAKGQVSLSGGVRTDSFDSGDPNYSTLGRYDAAKYKDNGDVATDSEVSASITSSGGVTVYGHVNTGPGGSVSTSGNVAIGSKAYINDGGTGIQPGYSSDTMNVSFPDVQVPFTSGYFTPGGANVGGTNYAYVIGPGNNQLSSFSMSGQQKAIVTGNAVLYVTGNVSFSGQSYLYIAPGASLKMYVAGSSASLSGNGVANANANATNFYYYGLPSNTSVSLSGNAAFTGVIYAPEANFSMSGGGNNNYDLVGAAVANSISMSGHFNFHYDENLARSGGNGSYVVTSWNEL